jgi:hypothetical protein
MQPHTTMRDRPAKLRDLGRAVDCISPVKEHGIGHWRIVVDCGVPDPFQPERPEGPDRGVRDQRLWHRIEGVI